MGNPIICRSWLPYNCHIEIHEHDAKDGQVFRKLGYFLLLLHKNPESRHWEIDALRGVAVVMMIVYHLVFDLTLFGLYQTDVYGGWWKGLARVTATLFILLAGVSLALSRARSRHQANGWSLYAHYVVRGLKLIGWGMVVTLVTWGYTGRLVILFGILHCIGAATILAYPFLRWRWVTLAAGIGVIALDYLTSRFPASHLVPQLLGLQPLARPQMDYFPLVPWFGVVLLGVLGGQLLYPGGAPRLDLPNLTKRAGAKELIWLGRHSLLIYLLHQPCLIAIITLINFFIQAS